MKSPLRDKQPSRKWWKLNIFKIFEEEMSMEEKIWFKILLKSRRYKPNIWIKLKHLQDFLGRNVGGKIKLQNCFENLFK